MKVVYKTKEVMNTTNDYNGLLNRPMINSHTLEGVVTLNDINTYTKEQIDELIGNSRSIEIVTALPVNLIENTLYYVGPYTGPDDEEYYDVYLVDEVRNVIPIGTSQFGEYFAGTGIDIDDDNYITAKIDNRTIIVDSENNLHANLSLDQVPVMVGATSSANGEKGLVPVPHIGDQTKYLFGSAEWKSIINIFYPVGSFFLADSSAHNPNTYFPGTTWTQIGDGRHLWTTLGGSGNSNARLPEISGTILFNPDGDNMTPSGVFSRNSYTQWSNGIILSAKGSGFYYNSGNTKIEFKASKGSYDSEGNLMDSEGTPYGKSNTVQPPAINICIWYRAS